MTPFPGLPDCALLLVNPNVPTPTPEVFATFARLGGAASEGRASSSPPGPVSGPGELVSMLRERGNDLIPAALQVAPAVGEVLAELAALPDALYSSMSGSGATCFALFADDAGAERAAARIAARRPHWWRHRGRLLGASRGA
jgi:4-diphosphocytidyl-2-C-methyl-D-erythritol kinase